MKQKINKINFKLHSYGPPCTRSSKQDPNSDFDSSKNILFYFKQKYVLPPGRNIFCMDHPAQDQVSKQDPNHLKYVWNASFKT